MFVCITNMKWNFADSHTESILTRLVCLQPQNCKSIVIPIAVFGLYSLQFLMKNIYIVAIDRIKFLFHLFIAQKFQLN